MASARHVILQRAPDEGKPLADAQPLGDPRELRQTLARFNIYPDGGRMPLGLDRLYGPGFVIEVPTSVDELRQVMAHIDDQETAWPVLSRMCRVLAWAMTDAETGRRFI